MNEAKRIEMLHRLASLAPGWLNGDAVQISRIALELADSLYNCMPEEVATDFYAFPEASGGVQLQYMDNDSYFSVDFEDTGGISVYFFSDEGDGTSYLNYPATLKETLADVLRFHPQGSQALQQVHP